MNNTKKYRFTKKGITVIVVALIIILAVCLFVFLQLNGYFDDKNTNTGNPTNTTSPPINASDDEDIDKTPTDASGPAITTRPAITTETVITTTPAATSSNGISKEPLEYEELYSSIFFEPESSTLTLESKVHLENFLAEIDLSDFIKVILEANAATKVSPSGETAAFNKRLALARANSVESYLLSKGFPKEYIEIRNLGSENPLNDNSTVASRKNNRRVDIYLSK